jgi:glycosyltransferase involved in cell wall biosynthesis
LTADRQRFTDRAVACFLAQSYRDAHLLIYDTGAITYEHSGNFANITHVRRGQYSRGRKIGALRNEAIDMVEADIIVTWDSDDWSAPERLERQVSSLRDSMATGYHNLLFLDTREWRGAPPMNMDAWEYDYHRFGGRHETEIVVGSSLAFWRESWQQKPYVENQTHEDAQFCRDRKVRAVNGVGLPLIDTPMLIAEVHGSNTSSSYAVFDQHKPHINPEWRRVPEWDVYARERLYP